MASKRVLPPGLEGKCPFVVLDIPLPSDTKDSSVDVHVDQFEHINEMLIKKSYRNMARKLHPDKNPNNPNAKENFDLLQKCYEFLLNAGSREDYISAILKDRSSRRRYLERDTKKNDMASKLAQRERMAAEARAAMNIKGGGTARARQYSDWADRTEARSAAETAAKNNEQDAWNMIKRLKKGSGAVGMNIGVPNYDMGEDKNTFNPEDIAKDTWARLQTNGPSSQAPDRSVNKMNFRGKWRDVQFVQSTISASKEIFLEYELETLSYLKVEDRNADDRLSMFGRNAAM